LILGARVIKTHDLLLVSTSRFFEFQRKVFLVSGSTVDMFQMKMKFRRKEKNVKNTIEMDKHPNRIAGNLRLESNKDIREVNVNKS
jgi:hypothetical protein